MSFKNLKRNFQGGPGTGNQRFTGFLFKNRLKSGECSIKEILPLKNVLSYLFKSEILLDLRSNRKLIFCTDNRFVVFSRPGPWLAKYSRSKT